MTAGGSPPAGPAGVLDTGSPPVSPPPASPPLASPPGAGPPAAGPPGAPPRPSVPAEREPLYTSGLLRWRRPVLRHHHRGEYRVGTLLVAAVLLVAVVAASGWVTGAEGDADRRFREFVVTAGVGEPVLVGGLRATVLEVRTVAQVAEQPGDGRDTGGVWVVVRLRVEAVDEPTALEYAAVADRQGRSWVGSERVEQPLIGYTFQPGIPVVGRVAFEVPRGTATDLMFRFGESGTELSTVAEIALPIDDAMVAEGLAAGQPLPLGEPEVVLPDLLPDTAGEP